MIQWGLLGQLHHIRAQWHRGNLPGTDSWQQPLPGGETLANGKKFDAIAEDLKKFKAALKTADAAEGEKLARKIKQWEAWASDAALNARDHDYRDFELPNGRKVSALEELCRWRLWERTGGGLMAELG